LGLDEIWIGQEHCGAGYYDAITTFALGLVESFVGKLEEQVNVVRSLFEGGDADRDSESWDCWLIGSGTKFSEPLADFLSAH
jgi:hypothetical protein